MRFAVSSVALAAIGLAGCTLQQNAQSSAQSSVGAGHQIAAQRCSACHAVELAGTSPRPDAPPLRDLFKRYPVDYLADAFVKGVHVGHPDMPTFRMSRREADALLSYLRSINPCEQPSSDRAAMERCFSPL